MMWDKRAILSLCMLLSSVGIYELYLYELFYGTWELRCVKGLYYASTACVLTLLTYFDIFGYKSCTQFNICTICKFTLIINFLFFAFTLYDILPNHRLYLYVFNGTILVATLAILIFGVRHEIFKD